MKHLLVTNDFPPKIGGIQSYLWELWRRLPAEDVTVLTTPYAGDAAFDAAQAFRVVRTKHKWLLPIGGLVDQINQLARETGAELVVLDPVFPMGLIGPHLKLPFVLIGHGAEFTIPLLAPIAHQLMKRSTKHAVGLIGGGAWVEQAMSDLAPNVFSISIPPGVDTTRFVPLDDVARKAARERFGLRDDDVAVVGVSRLVPRKGFDRLISVGAALGATRPKLRVLIAGAGREGKRLEDLVRKLRAPVTMLGRVDDEDLPSLYAAADVFSMPCHNRWMGLEQEGFGIVFLEAAACGVPSVAGLSGGSAEAVVDGETGFVAAGNERRMVHELAAGLQCLVDDPSLRQKMGERARRRAEELFAYDELAVRLKQFLQEVAAH